MAKLRPRHSFGSDAAFFVSGDDLPINDIARSLAGAGFLMVESDLDAAFCPARRTAQPVADFLPCDFWKV